MTITLQEAAKILRDARAVIIKENVLVYPTLSKLTGDAGGEFLRLSCEAGGQDFSMQFVEGANREVRVDGGSLLLTETAGQEIQVTILVAAHLEKEPEQLRVGDCLANPSVIVISWVLLSP